MVSHEVNPFKIFKTNCVEGWELYSCLTNNCSRPNQKSHLITKLIAKFYPTNAKSFQPRMTGKSIVVYITGLALLVAGV